jgi:hypothetical protein
MSLLESAGRGGWPFFDPVSKRAVIRFSHNIAKAFRRKIELCKNCFCISGGHAKNTINNKK